MVVTRSIDRSVTDSAFRIHTGYISLPYIKVNRNRLPLIPLIKNLVETREKALFN